MGYTPVGHAYQRLGLDSPKRLSDFIYAHGREIDLNRCPVLAGRRLIDEAYLPMLLLILRRRGLTTLDTVVPK